MPTIPAEPLAPAAAPAAAAAALAATDDPPSQPCCRVCYDSADGKRGSVLLSPCQCHGTLRFIHQRCLQEWLQHAPPATRMLCSVCHTAFVLPPGFEVPPTDYSQHQLQQQVWEAAEEAAAEAEHQERRLRARQPWPLGLILVVGGTAAAMVAAALLSVRLGKRYHEQQVQERRAECGRQFQKWLRERRIPDLQAENAQLKAQLQALRSHQRLDRWLPPPLVGRRRQRAERAVAAIARGALEAELLVNAYSLAVLDLKNLSGSDSNMGSGTSHAEASSSSHDQGGSSGGGREPPSRPSQPPRQQVGEGRRHNWAEPVLRAVHGLLSQLGQQ